MRSVIGTCIRFYEEKGMIEDGFIIDSFTMIVDAIEKKEITQKETT